MPLKILFSTEVYEVQNTPPKVQKMSTNRPLNDCVKLSFSNGKVMTFSPADYLNLRKNHRILGKFVGIPVCFQRNMLWNAMPVCFSEYEVKLMLEEGLAVIEEKTSLKEGPSENVKKKYADHQEKIISELQNPYVESRLETIRHNMENIIRGKRKKLLKMGLKEEEITLTPEEILKGEAVRIRQSIGNKTVYTHIPSQHQFSIPSTLLTEFSTLNDKKFKVFRDLWNKGFFVSGGDSFGCDFLTYPGDSLYYHASRMVHVVEPDQLFDAKFFTSCARLSVSVNKECVFAYVEEDSVTYQTLHWDNPKLREVYAGLKAETSQAEGVVEEDDGKEVDDTGKTGKAGSCSVIRTNFEDSHRHLRETQDFEKSEPL